MALFLTTMLYIIPIIICWIFIYTFTQDEGRRNEQVDKIIFAIFLTLSIIPVINIIFAFIISVKFIMSKPKKYEKIKHNTTKY